MDEGQEEDDSDDTLDDTYEDISEELLVVMVTVSDTEGSVLLGLEDVVKLDVELFVVEFSTSDEDNPVVSVL
jgi:hypothetical protein